MPVMLRPSYEEVYIRSRGETTKKSLTGRELVYGERRNDEGGGRPIPENPRRRRGGERASEKLEDR